MCNPKPNSPYEDVNNIVIINRMSSIIIFSITNRFAMGSAVSHDVAVNGIRKEYIEVLDNRERV